MVVASKVAVGLKVPVQVMPPSAEIIAESTPFAAVILASLSKPATASEKTRLTVAVSPICRALSEMVKELTAGARVSSEKEKAEDVPVLPGAPVLVAVIDLALPWPMVVRLVAVRL